MSNSVSLKQRVLCRPDLRKKSDHFRESVSYTTLQTKPPDILPTVDKNNITQFEHDNYRALIQKQLKEFGTERTSFHGSVHTTLPQKRKDDSTLATAVPNKTRKLYDNELTEVDTHASEQHQSRESLHEVIQEDTEILDKKTSAFGDYNAMAICDDTSEKTCHVQVATSTHKKISRENHFDNKYVVTSLPSDTLHWDVSTSSSIPRWTETEDGNKTNKDPQTQKDFVGKQTQITSIGENDVYSGQNSETTDTSKSRANKTDKSRSLRGATENRDLHRCNDDMLSPVNCNFSTSETAHFSDSFIPYYSPPSDGIRLLTRNSDNESNLKTNKRSSLFDNGEPIISQRTKEMMV